MRTANKFKVGDKVHVDPGEYSGFEHYIRATITKVENDEKGYWLRAFGKDLPGIWMFNVWDKDLTTRSSRARKPRKPN